MTVRSNLPLLSLVATLALAACNQAPVTTDNAMVNVENAADYNDSAFNDAEPVVENLAADDTPAVDIVAVPAAPVNATPVDRTERDDASRIEDDIRTGRGIQRVRYHDGWAWMRDGQIIRTAGPDGRDVAYFRPGVTAPFFVQRDGRSYLYRDGKPVRVIGSDGRARDPDADRRREADNAARDAETHRRQADDARRHARDGGRPDNRPHPTPTPTPTPSPTPTRDHHGHDGRPGAGGPSATPSPQPSSPWRHPGREPGREPHRQPGSN